jgi:hypothetical protein
MIPTNINLQQVFLAISCSVNQLSVDLSSSFSPLCGSQNNDSHTHSKVCMASFPGTCACVILYGKAELAGVIKIKIQSNHESFG